MSFLVIFLPSKYAWSAIPAAKEVSSASAIPVYLYEQHKIPHSLFFRGKSHVKN